MKTKIPHLILALSLYAAQSANADLIFTFGLDGAGNTSITVSGDTATAGGSGGSNEREEIGFSLAGSGSVRQRGFSQRDDSLFPPLDAFASLGSGTLTDTISLTSTGITGGSPTLIDSFQFDSLNFYPLVMDGLANNGDTLSFAGSPDVNGVMPVNYTAFQSLWGQSFSALNDNWTFVFTVPPVPEPSSAALLGLGLSSLLLRRRRRRS